MKVLICVCSLLWCAGVLAGERVYTGVGEDLYALFAGEDFYYGECHISLNEGGGAVQRNIDIMRLEKATFSNGETYDRIVDSSYIEIVPDETKVRGTSRVLRDYYELTQRDDGSVYLKVKDYDDYYKGGNGPFSIIGGGGGRYAGYIEETLKMVIDPDSRTVLRLENTMQWHTRGLLGIFNFLKKKSTVNCQ